MTTRVPAMLTNLHITYIDIPVPFDLGEGISHLCPTAVWCKGHSELSCAILEPFNILCNLWSKIIHLRKSGLHIDIVVESM